MNCGCNPPRDAVNSPPKHLSKLKKTTYTRSLTEKTITNPQKSLKIHQNPSKSPQNPPKIPQFIMVFWCLPQVTLIEVLNPAPSAVVVGSTGSSSSMKRSTYCRRAAASCGGGSQEKGQTRGKNGEITRENRGNSPGKIGKTMENLLISWGKIWRESIEGWFDGTEWCGFQKRWIRC